MTLREIMVGYPGTKDIRQHPYYQGAAGQWVWKFYHHRMTQAGRWFFGATISVFFIIALYWSLDTQTYILALYAAGAWVVSFIVALLPLRVRATMRHAERINAGQTLQVEVELTNIGRFSIPELYILAWGLPVAVDADPESGEPVGTLRRGETRHATLRYRCNQRGAFTLGGCRAESDFPFGLLSAYRVLPCSTRLIVHPTYTPLTRVDLPTGRRYQPGGITLASQVGDSFEYQGSREFREGDRLRDIDWRATARHAGTQSAPLIVREWREEYFLRVGVVLDTHVPGAGPKGSGRLFATEVRERLSRGEQSQRQLRIDTLERAISVCAAVSDALAQRDYIVDLFAAGPNLYHLTAGRSLAYREQILDILACVEGSPEEPFATVAPRLAEDLSRLTTVICIVLDWDAPRQKFVEELLAHGVAVKILWVSDNEDAVPIDSNMKVLPPSAFVGQGVSEL